MAEHERYVCRHKSACQCVDHRGTIFLHDGELRYEVIYEPEQVTFECRRCGDAVAVFYREPEIEKEATKADQAMVGWVIKARRIVSWVGYAKNSGTVQLGEQDVLEKARAEVMRLFGRAVASNPIGDASSPVLTEEQAAYFLSDCDWRIRAGIMRPIRYKMRGKAYRTNPLRARGLWFQDVPVEGEVMKVVRCVTGSQVPGQSDYDDCEMPYLGDSVHHSLYVVDSGIVWRESGRAWHGVLVYPSDVEVVND